MWTKGKPTTNKDLAGFSVFLLDRINEVAREGIRIARELQLPILKYLVMSDEDLMKLAVPGYVQILNGFVNGTSDQVIEKSVRSWLANQLPMVEREQIVSEDIMLVAQSRKNLLLHFLPQYTTDVNDIIAIIREIDDYITRLSTASYNAYTSILQSKIGKYVEDLRINDKLFRQAQQLTKIGNYVWYLKEGSLKWSDEMYRIYELEIGSDVNESKLRRYNHPEDDEAVDENIRTSIRTGTPFNFYYRIVLGDKRQKVINARGEAQYDAAGNAVALFGTAQDVTEQKAVETRLELNQKFIQKVADAAPSIITTYNLKTGEYLFVSDGLRKLLGYSPSQPIREGVSFFMNILHPDDVAPTVEKTEKVVALTNASFKEGMEEPIEQFQNRLRHANGEYRWFQTFGTVFDRDSSGEVLHILNISLDITEKIKAEQVLLQKTNELEQSNRSLEEFAFIASHDLKEPLRKISTLTDRILLMENTKLSDDGKVYLQKVVSSSLRMQQMIEDLLSLSQVSADRSFQPVNLDALMTEVLQTFDQKMEESGAKVITSKLPVAVVVPSQFSQLFQNMVSNSLKFARTDTPVVLKISHEYISGQSAGQYNLQAADRYLKLTFTDNGIGFDNKFLPKIFSIFQRLHPRNKYEGTGIGLSICKRIVENHGGVIFANGIVNEGATFTLIIPDQTLT